MTPALVLYLFISAYAGGLLSPYLTSERDQVIAATSPHRPVALALILLHCFAAIGSEFDVRFGVLANAAYVAALIILAKEVQSRQRETIREAAKYGLAALFSLLALFAVSRGLLGLSRSYAYVPNIAAFIANAFILVATYRHHQQSRSIYLQHAFAASLAAGLIMLIRIGQIHFQHVYSLALANESQILLALRALNAVSFFVLLSAITNFHFQKLWRREHDYRVETEQGMLASLLALAQARDNETGNHIVRTKNYIRVLAENLKQKGWFSVPDVDAHIEELFNVAPLHDIGKVGIPDHILLKPGRLDPAEWEVMKTHALIGEEVLKAAVPRELSDNPTSRSLLNVAIEIAGGHHERWDGQGYPRGLAGEAIPKAARLMTVADIYDALTSERPYKKTWPHAKAVDEITHLSGTKLDPMVVAAFLEEQDRFLEIARRFKDA